MTYRRSVLLLCSLIAILLYLPTLGHDFVFDDRGVVVQNPLLQDPADVPRLLTSPYWQVKPEERTLYRPLTSLSFAVDRAVAGGMHPAWFHFTNVLLHAAATWLVTLLALRLGSGAIAAAAGGLLFAVHPVHVEAVAGIVGRADILATCAVLVAVLCHHRAMRAGGRAGRGAVAGAWVAAFLAIMAKESGVIAPLLCVLVDVAYPPGRDAAARGRRTAMYAGYAGVLIAAVLVRRAVLGSVGIGQPIPFVDNPAAAAGPLAGRLTALGALLRSARLLVWPAALSADYSYDQIPIIESPFHPLAISGLLLAVLVVAGGAWLVRRRRAGGFALLFVAIAAAPTANLVFFVGTLLAERLLYLPSVGLSLLLAWVVGEAEGRRRGRLVTVGAALLLVLAAGRSWRRLPDWKDDFALYRSAAAVSPRSTRIRYNLGNAYLRRGRYSEAERHLREALRIYPEFTDARINLGMALVQQGRPDEAIPVLEKAAEQAPRRAIVPVNLGLAYRARGDPGRAEEMFERALSIDPCAARAWNNLGSLDLARGAVARAVERLQEAVRCAPGDALLRVNLADALTAAGRLREAESHFEEAYRIDPDLPDAHRGRGELLLGRGDRAGAEREFRAALDGDPGQARAANFLGYLLALRGEEDAAIRAYEQALRIDPSLHDAHRSLGLLLARRPPERERAIRHLEMSLAIAPDQEDADATRELLRRLRSQ